MTDEHDLEPDDSLEDGDPEDALRYAPRVEPDEDETPDAEAEEHELIFGEDNADAMPLAPELDLDAALAAVSTLDDMLAEQEAAEQAEIARQEAEVEAEQQRIARMERPELFFPMPPVLAMQRGRFDSVIPALALILIGIWLTFTLTTGAVVQTPLLVLALAGAAALAFLARWLASGRWALGSLFFALLILLTGAVLAVLVLNGMLAQGWPLLLVGPGLAYLLTGIIAGESRLLLPGVGLCFSGLAALILSYQIVAGSTLAALWPAALVILLVLFLLPSLARR